MNMKFYLKISSILVAAAFLSTLPVEAQTFRQTKQGITGTTQGMDIEIQFVSPEIAVSYTHLTLPTSDLV